VNNPYVVFFFTKTQYSIDFWHIGQIIGGLILDTFHDVWVAKRLVYGLVWSQYYKLSTSKDKVHDI
jgi:hypothetical protein